MPAEGKEFCLTGISLEYIPGEDERDSGFSISNIVFISEDSEQTLPLILSSEDHWFTKDGISTISSTQAESWNVVLQDEGLEDIALAFMTRERLFGEVLAAEQALYGKSKRLELQNLSMRAGRWCLLWKIKAIDARKMRDDDSVSSIQNKDPVNLDDNVKVITALSEACESSKHDHRLLESHLDSLIPLLREHVLPSAAPWSLVPLGSALRSLQRATEVIVKDATTYPPSSRIEMLPCFTALLLKKRWKQTYALEDLNNAISQHQLVASHPQCLHLRRHRPAAIHARDEAILVEDDRPSLAAMPSPDPIARSANLYFRRYQKLGRTSDLNKSLALQQRVVGSTLPEDPSYGDALGDLARYSRPRIGAYAESDIDEALTTASRGLAATRKYSNVYFFHEYLQALAFFRRFGLSRSTEHLDSAASVMLQSRCHTLSSCRLKEGMGRFVGDLGTCFQALCEPGSSEYTHKAVACLQKYVAIANTPRAYHQLGRALVLRYCFDGSTNDLEGAIEALSTSIQTSERGGGHADPEVLMELATAFKLDDVKNVNVGRNAQAMDLVHQVLLCSQEHEPVHHEALELLTELKFRRAMWQRLSIYASSASQEELQKADFAFSLDLSEIEEILRWLSILNPDGHPPMEKKLVLSRIWLDSGTRHIADVIDNTQTHYRDDPSFMHQALSLLCAVSAEPNHHDLSIQEARLAALDKSVDLETRFKWAYHWVQACSGEDDAEQRLEAYNHVIELVATLAGLGQRISERHRRIAESVTGIWDLKPGPSFMTESWAVAQLPLEAAAHALQCHRVDKALEWLEQGRCLVWNQLQTLRIPLETLEARDPELAHRVQAVSKVLEGGEVESVPRDGGEDLGFLEEVALAEDSAAQARARRDWDDLLEQTRLIPGFENFLRPTQCSTLLQDLPEQGPVVILNADQLRCDAIVLCKGIEEPLLVPLPQISYKKAEAMQQRLKNELISDRLRLRNTMSDRAEEGTSGEDEKDDEGCAADRGLRKVQTRSIEAILKDLWVAVVKPVLDSLAFNTKMTMPTTRIWWCPTGPFSFLPIHAAGIYGPGASSECLADYAVSSYTPTVSALTTRVRETRERKTGSSRLLLVCVPEAEGKGLPLIPGTTAEVQALRSLSAVNDIDCITLEGEEATSKRTMDEIANCNIIHLACHASQNVTDPVKSSFYLQDGRLELSTIIKAELEHADLAFLSACQTGAGDEKLSNEAVHLAAGVLAAGFRGTVATMWAIKDFHAPKVSEDFYRYLIEECGGMEGGINGENAAYALHYATQQLRKRLGKSTRESLLAWVPYVHYGL
ncbi:CHAT domain-containing protein [Coprinopsis sp. MPI-PUGE-AT-0042]|nr:CHAT domain-containing protein [Coprinopsis sp. MPI-PUGE-AT-0042]